MFSGLLHSRKAGLVLKSIVTYAVLAMFVVSVAFPIYFLLLTSFRSPEMIYSRQGMLIPRALTLENYGSLFRSSQDLVVKEGVATRGADVQTWLLNSGVVAVITTGVSLAIGILAGYSLARLHFRGAGVLARTALLTYLVPQTLLFIPLYLLLSKFGLLNSRWALIITYPTFIAPFCTWVLFGYFKSIPSELEDAARIDGCTRVQALLKVVLPIAAPGIVTAGIFGVTASWNEFLYALTFVSSSQYRMMPTGLSGLMDSELMEMGQLFAAAVVATLPVIVLYMVLHRRVVSGLTAGAIK
jgi:multiple sugar transport system permease protein